MPRFTRFAAVDWSGAKGSSQKGIAIATCPTGDEPPRLERAGHVWSRQEALDWTIEAAGKEAILIGFDLSPAFPFVDRGAYFPGWALSPRDARSLWTLVEDIAADDPDLAATSFVGNDEAGRYFRHHKRLGDLFGAGRGRLRRVEARTLENGTASPYSCFNLVGAAQVGKSSLTGMRLFKRLDGRIPIWPFDELPQAGAVVVEIYTSLAAVGAGVRKGRSKIRDREALDKALTCLGSRRHEPLSRYDDHATDAMLSAAWLRTIAGDPEPWAPKDMTREVARTEGWTFGVL